MKKKTIIIIVTVVAIAAIGFAFWRMRTIGGVVSSLKIDDSLKEKLKIRAEKIKKDYERGDEDTKFACESMMEAFGYNKAKTFVMQAAFELQSEGENISINLN